jgi:hypothetical protein
VYDYDLRLPSVIIIIMIITNGVTTIIGPIKLSSGDLLRGALRRPGGVRAQSLPPACGRAAAVRSVRKRISLLRCHCNAIAKIDRFTKTGSGQTFKQTENSDMRCGFC